MKLSNDVLDSSGNKMAQLVDGRAQQMFQEFEELFHERGPSSLARLPEFKRLDQEETQFAFGLLASMLMHNASAFDRRVRQTTLDFPALLLGIARVRPELPDPRRQAIARPCLSARKNKAWT